MKIKMPSIPIIAHDPYFSYWTKGQELNKNDIIHWTERSKIIRGDVIIDGEAYRFIGIGNKEIKQIDYDITFTKSTFIFKNEQIELKVSFLNPLLLDDLYLLSLPITYVINEIKIVDGKKHDVSIRINFNENLTFDTTSQGKIVSDTFSKDGFSISYLGKYNQPILARSGDDILIDYGYLFIGINENDGKTYIRNNDIKDIMVEFPFKGDKKEVIYAIGYDDIASINYFGNLRKGYWAKNTNIVDALINSLNTYESVQNKAKKFDIEFEREIKNRYGEDYLKLAIASYRQTIAAHKLITDEKGNLVYVSKENSSNGCAATVDVTYPSAPLFLHFNPELVLAMLRPILEFAKMPVWKYDFCPHDVGRYPHLIGQCYGLTDISWKDDYTNESTIKPFYLYSKNSTIYADSGQMPVEESADVLILLAYISKIIDIKDFLKENLNLFKMWIKYLLKYGKDPESQLSTDDFLGHLAHNVNLAMKSSIGIEAYSIIMSLFDKEESIKYHEKAKEFASWIISHSLEKDHTLLAYDKPGTWSLKYNLVWDKIFKSELYPQEFLEKEFDFYLSKQEIYGISLDCRSYVSKTDWLIRISQLTNNKNKQKEIFKLVARFLEESERLVPFSDQYLVNTPYQPNNYFKARSVQGGIFIPLLISD